MSATVERTGDDQALVTVNGTRDVTTMFGTFAGSAVAIYDLDEVLEGTYTSLYRAVIRARELAPDAPTQYAYLFRFGRLARGPAPTQRDLRQLTRTLPPGSEILGMPAGYTVLQRQFARDEKGATRQLGTTRFFLVRDRPAISPLDVTGVREAIPATAPEVDTVPLALTDAGRASWDALLAEVAARASSAGRPQRIAMTANGGIWQLTTADAAGRLDTREGSPAFEFSGEGSANGGRGAVAPISVNTPQNGAIPALVWVAETYRVGAPEKVAGQRVTPLPKDLVRLLSAPGLEPADVSSARRVLVTEGLGGQWSIWRYVLTTGAAKAAYLTSVPGYSFTGGCGPDERIAPCINSAEFLFIAVPTQARTLRLTPRTGPAREVRAGGGIAAVFGQKGAIAPSYDGPVALEAFDRRGRSIAKATARLQLP